MSQMKLKAAFDFFDEDHSGSISVEEIKRIFANVGNETLLKAIVDEADVNHDGEVRYMNSIPNLNRFPLTRLRN